MSMFIKKVDIFNRYVDSIDTSGFFLTRTSAIDITLLLGKRMIAQPHSLTALIPRKMTIFRWGPKGVSGA
ncbi:hypothetical protein EAH79_02775 [Sphingomonas koreensis]|nr:hypothetical protein EAH79_02775 [Sphingomonas koreensis]